MNHWYGRWWWDWGTCFMYSIESFWCSMNLAKFTWTETWMGALENLKTIITIFNVIIAAAILIFTTADPGKLISGIESESERHLDPNVLNRSKHVLVRDQMPPRAASVWRPETQCKIKCADFSNMDEELVSCPELHWQCCRQLEQLWCGLSENPKSGWWRS